MPTSALITFVQNALGKKKYFFVFGCYRYSFSKELVIFSECLTKWVDGEGQWCKFAATYWHWHWRRWVAFKCIKQSVAHSTTLLVENGRRRPAQETGGSLLPACPCAHHDILFMATSLAGNLFGEYRKNLHMKNYYCNPFEREGGRPATKLCSILFLLPAPSRRRKASRDLCFKFLRIFEPQFEAQRTERVLWLDSWATKICRTLRLVFPITQHCPATSSGGVSVLKSFVVQISYLDICGKCENIFDQIAHRVKEQKSSRLADGWGDLSFGKAMEWVAAVCPENQTKKCLQKKGIYGNEETALIETIMTPPLTSPTFVRESKHT